MPPISFGSVVLVKDLPDTNGVNIKPLRPCIVITPDSEIDEGSPIAVMAISTLLPGPVPADCVLLPFHRQGRSRTGLTTRCAAFGRWVAIVERDRIDRRIGHVPNVQLLAVAEMLVRINEEG